MDELADVAPRPKADKVVCPGIILKVGPTVMLPCRPGAEIVKARSVEVDGRYCAKVHRGDGLAASHGNAL